LQLSSSTSEAAKPSGDSLAVPSHRQTKEYELWQTKLRNPTSLDVRKRLEPYYDILDFYIEGAMLYFRAKKR
jgi:hypothetical protein